MAHKLDEVELANRRIANDDIGSSYISGMNHEQLNAHIENNITNMTDVREYLKELSKTVLAITNWLD